MPYVITEACVDVKDNSCIAECPVDCIYEGDRQLYINPVECIDCGACEPACPVEAIHYDDYLPEESRDAARRQLELFAPLGKLGGARAYGKLNADHPEVASLPLRPADPESR